MSVAIFAWTSIQIANLEERKYGYLQSVSFVVSLSVAGVAARLDALRDEPAVPQSRHNTLCILSPLVLFYDSVLYV